jgi:predicted transcriptional regulator
MRFMARPKQEQPTPAELEVLKVLWQRGPGTVRDVMLALEPRPRRAYTSVMSLMNVMAQKGLLTRKLDGRAFVYQPRAPRERTLGRMVNDLVGRAFEGSTAALVAHLLDQSSPTPKELVAIRRAVDEYQQQKQSP